jgi:hypothetical protein
MTVQRRDILPKSICGPSTGNGASGDPSIDPWTGVAVTPDASRLTDGDGVSSQVSTLGDTGAPVYENVISREK